MNIKTCPNKALDFLVVGAQLQSIKIFSINLTLCFIKEFNGRLEYVYLNTSASFEVGMTQTIENSNKKLGFFDHRAHHIGDLYKLIGSRIDAYEIIQAGVLVLQSGTNYICFYPDKEDNSEVVWEIYDGEETPDGIHRTIVSLDDSLNVHAYKETTLWTEAV